jgi:hypothetical protein
LESIINEQAEGSARVERDDIALLAMSGLREQYLMMRMKDGNAAPQEAEPRARSLRNYLYDKYVFRLEESREVETQEPASETAPRFGQRPAA